MRRVFESASVAALLLCAAASIHAQSQSMMGDEYFNCSECQTCTVDPDFDIFIPAIVVVGPGEEVDGYVLGIATQFNCKYTCGDLISCRGPIDFSQEDLVVLAEALDMPVTDARSYFERYGGRSILVRHDEKAVQILGCNNSLIAHLPIAAD